MTASLIPIVLALALPVPVPVSDSRLILGIHPKAEQAQIGTTLLVSYELQNASTETLSGCVPAWNTFVLNGVKGQRAVVAFTDHGVGTPETSFHLPPGFRLGWDAEIVIRDVGQGWATLQGTLLVECGPAAGELESQPIPIFLTAAPKAPEERSSPPPTR